MSVTQFRNHVDVGASTVGPGGKPVGANTFAVATGDGAQFAPTHGRLTLVQAAGFDLATGQVTDKSKRAVYTYEAIAGDGLTTVAVQAGSTDLAFAAGDYVFDAADFTDIVEIQQAINAIETAGGNAAFGPSGAGHAQGLVPDPGAAAGATHYLREDGTWAVPTAGGTPGGSAGQMQWNNAGAFAGVPGSTVATTGNLLTLKGVAIGDVPLTIQAIANQTGNLLTVNNSSGAPLVTIDHFGNMVSQSINGQAFTTGNSKISIFGNAQFASTVVLQWSSNSIYSGTPDILITRAAAGICQIQGGFAIVPGTVQTIAAGGTITIAASGAYQGIATVSAAANIAGLILTVGTVAGQQLTIMNTSAFTLTFDVAGTSHVSTGVGCVIGAGMAKVFVWDSTNLLWRPTS